MTFRCGILDIELLIILPKCPSYKYFNQAKIIMVLNLQIYDAICQQFILGPEINEINGVRSTDTPSISLIIKDGMVEVLGGKNTEKQVCFKICLLSS